MPGVVVTASARGGAVACTDRGGLAVGAIGVSGAELGVTTGASGITTVVGRVGAIGGTTGSSVGWAPLSARLDAGSSSATSVAVRPRTIGSLPA